EHACTGGEAGEPVDRGAAVAWPVGVIVQASEPAALGRASGVSATIAGVDWGALHRKAPASRSSATEPEGSVKVFPVSACVMTNATPAGGATVTGGEVGVGEVVAGRGRSVDEFALGDGVWLRAGACGAT